MPSRRSERLHGADDVLAAVTAGVRVARVDGVGAFTGQYQPVPDTGLADEPAESTLALPRGVEVRGVDEVAARPPDIAGESVRPLPRSSRKPHGSRRCRSSSCPAPAGSPAVRTARADSSDSRMPPIPARLGRLRSRWSLPSPWVLSPPSRPRDSPWSPSPGLDQRRCRRFARPDRSLARRPGRRPVTPTGVTGVLGTRP